jgi:hypothetical protein
VALAALVASGVGPGISVAAQDDETLEWLDDYDEALALAEETGKPLLVEFRCAP